jgi:hypothetical protein
MKNAVFWDVMPCGSCKSRHFIYFTFRRSIVQQQVGYGTHQLIYDMQTISLDRVKNKMINQTVDSKSNTCLLTQ